MYLSGIIFYLFLKTDIYFILFFNLNKQKYIFLFLCITLSFLQFYFLSFNAISKLQKRRKNFTLFYVLGFFLFIFKFS